MLNILILTKSKQEWFAQPSQKKGVAHPLTLSVKRVAHMTTPNRDGSCGHTKGVP